MASTKIAADSFTLTGRITEYAENWSSNCAPPWAIEFAREAREETDMLVKLAKESNPEFENDFITECARNTAARAIERLQMQFGYFACNACNFEYWFEKECFIQRNEYKRAAKRLAYVKDSTELDALWDAVYKAECDAKKFGLRRRTVDKSLALR